MNTIGWPVNMEVTSGKQLPFLPLTSSEFYIEFDFQFLLNFRRIKIFLQKNHKSYKNSWIVSPFQLWPILGVNALDFLRFSLWSAEVCTHLWLTIRANQMNLTLTLTLTIYNTFNTKSLLRFEKISLTLKWIKLIGSTVGEG